MKSVVSSRSALIIAAGLLACLYGPLQPTHAAAAPADGATQASPAPVAKKKAARPHAKQVKKKTAPAKPAKPSAQNTKDDSKTNTAAADAAKAPASEADAATSVPPSSTLPASVANANAQLPQVAAADGATPSPTTSTPGANRSEPASSQPAAAPVVAPDEVNELDRAAEAPAPTTMASTAAPQQPAPATVGTAQVSSATANEGAWDKASLIGKIFIAAGGLLTLASAARMFMA